MRLAGLAPLLAALLAPAAIGQGAASGRERFELFNACKPMQLVIERLPGEAADIGLARGALQAAAESRLRAARLYTEDSAKAGFAYLYVNVHVVGAAHAISVEYKKIVTDAFGIPNMATTWNTRSTGTHGRGSAGFILSHLSRHLDRFLSAYLRANEEACGAPASRP